MLRRGGVIAGSEHKGAIASFGRLLWQVMTNEPYASARRVFWIVDNGSDHRGKASIKRLQRRWPTLIVVYLPFMRAGSNQVEIYHSIIYQARRAGSPRRRSTAMATA
jgi:hypothetical protein